MECAVSSQQLLDSYYSLARGRISVIAIVVSSSLKRSSWKLLKRSSMNSVSSVLVHRRSASSHSLKVAAATAIVAVNGGWRSSPSLESTSSEKSYQLSQCR